MNGLGTRLPHTRIMPSTSLVPRPPPFFVLRFAFSIIHGSGRARKTGKLRPGNTYHVNDVWWTRGGRRGGVAHQPTRVQINDRASFLPVKSSTVELVNLRRPGYR